ncbi:hypothetical protein QE412_000610 [Microbacterium trichothecenolyticum]|uniref:Uncharacterized protein n=1 Tax=Microbacterium trichothecenolyticum TaxID=69370 RepID=A0ABU0TQU2_MICTR|nr:hypothetical protein [Microbacterium trichothecenolyticum]
MRGFRQRQQWRVRVLVRRLAQQPALLLQQADEGAVGVQPQLPRDVGHSRQEPAAVVERDDRRQSRGIREALVVLTVGGGLVHDARAVADGDVVVDEDLPGILRPPHRRVGVVVEEAVVRDALELGTQDRGLHGRAGGIRAVVPEVLGVVRQQVFGQQVAVRDSLEGLVGRAVGSGVHVGGAVRAPLDDGVPDAGTNSESEVRRQGPRRRRPRERPDAGEAQRLGLRADEWEGDGDRGVLPHLVDVVVHAQLVRRQGRLIAPAVRQHTVALVGEALVVQGLERPQDALHVGGVERLVPALEVDPARLTGDVVLPLARVLEHRLAGLGVEGRHAHALDLVLLGDPELLHRLELGRQAVRVPPEDAVDLLAAHGLEAREEVLGVPGQQVPVVRQAVGERRAVVEHPLLGALAVRDRGAEGVVLGPEGERLLLDRGETGTGDDGCRAGGALRGRRGRGIRGRVGGRAEG